MADRLDLAMRLLGPLEGRIMRLVWSGSLGTTFTVRDVRVHLPELAYTTVMTTVARLAEKGLLEGEHPQGHRAYSYCIALTADDFLRESGRREVDELVKRFGNVALAAFSTRLETLTPRQRERLRRTEDS